MRCRSRAVANGGKGREVMQGHGSDKQKEKPPPVQEPGAASRELGRVLSDVYWATFTGS